ncbi:MAG TPA: NUDIX domain-containing protein [Candidatus Dormibacteraeota bacterium]
MSQDAAGAGAHRHAADGGPRFCPRCGDALGEALVEGRRLAACPQCGWVAFRDPKVVAVAVLDSGGGAVWLIRRAIAPCIGEWALPGGYVDFDEHPRTAAARECREEIGCDVEIDELVAVEHAAFRNGGVVVVAYAGRIVDGVPAPGAEALEVAAHAAGAPPPLAFTTHEQILRRYAGSRRGAPAEPGTGPGALAP